MDNPFFIKPFCFEKDAAAHLKVSNGLCLPTQYLQYMYL